MQEGALGNKQNHGNGRQQAYYNYSSYLLSFYDQNEMFSLLPALPTILLSLIRRLQKVTGLPVNSYQ
jgi:hypothetical protein